MQRSFTSPRSASYSPTGNIESIGTGFGGGTVGSYGTGNRITYFGGGFGGGCGYTTDFDGNVTQRACPGDTINFYWAADGRLDSLKRNGVKIAYAYDANGRMVRRDSAGSVKSHFIWDGDHLLAELGSSANTLVAQYAYNGLDDLHAVIIGGTPYYAHTDAMGNIRGYTSNGTQYGTYRYDEWGRPVSGAGAFGILERPHWKGALWMEPGADLYYMRNRWYEPRTGRFLSEDPIGLAGGANAYTFAGSDPLNLSDPLGLHPCPAGQRHWPDHTCTVPAGTPINVVAPRRPPPMPSWDDWCMLIDGSTSACRQDRDDGLAGPRLGPQEAPVPHLEPTREDVLRMAQDNANLIIAAYGLLSGGFAKVLGLIRGWTAVKVTFTAHGAAHAAQAGANAARIQRAIQDQVTRAARTASSTGEFWGRVVVDGTTWQYRAYTVRPGVISIGTYYIP